MTLTRTLPPSAYKLSTTHMARELDVLRSQWVILCHEDAVSKPGQNLAFSLFGQPIVVRRTMGGELAVLNNVCPHRGGPLAWPGQTETRLLQCRYHGWTFKHDGTLIEPVGFGRDRKDIHCAAVHGQPLEFRNRNGLILARLSPGQDTAHRPLGKSPPTLPDSLKARLKQSRLEAEESFSAACNWKLYVENWLEAYHLQPLHRDLSADVAANTYQVHAGSVWAEHNATPKGGAYGGYWVFLYPATAINFYIDGFSIEQISPKSAKETEVRYQFYVYDGPDGIDGDRSITDEINLTRTVTQEDIAAAEHVQSCLDAGTFDVGYISADREPGIPAFYQFLKKTGLLTPNAIARKAYTQQAKTDVYAPTL